MRESRALEQDGADGVRGCGQWYLEPLKEVWRVSEEQGVEYKQRVQDETEAESIAERKGLGLAAKEEGGRDEDGGGKHEEGVDRRAHYGHRREGVGERARRCMR